MARKVWNNKYRLDELTNPAGCRFYTFDCKLSSWFDENSRDLIAQQVRIFAANCRKGYQAEGGGYVEPNEITGRQKLRILLQSLKYDDANVQMQLFDAVRDIRIRKEETKLDGLAHFLNRFSLTLEACTQ